MKTLLAYKKSTFELYSSLGNKALKDFLSQDNVDVRILEESHQAQQSTLETVVADLQRNGFEFDMIYRAELENTPTGDYGLVIAVGGDGTIMEMGRYTTTSTLLGVNSDPTNSVGFYACCNASEFSMVLQTLDTQPKTNLPRISYAINGEQIPFPAMNDLLIAHTSPAAMTRYRLQADGEKIIRNGWERLRSSGLLIATAGGSSSWSWETGGPLLPLTEKKFLYHERDQRDSGYHVASHLLVESLTREGMIYADGEHEKYPFTLGDTITIKSGIPLKLIGNLEDKRRKYQ